MNSSLIIFLKEEDKKGRKAFKIKNLFFSFRCKVQVQRKSAKNILVRSLNGVLEEKKTEKKTLWKFDMRNHILGIYLVIILHLYENHAATFSDVIFELFRSARVSGFHIFLKLSIHVFIYCYYKIRIHQVELETFRLVTVTPQCVIYIFTLAKHF